jgi:hypothetical protein
MDDDKIRVFAEYNSKVKPYLTNITRYRVDGKDLEEIALLLSVDKFDFLSMFKEIKQLKDAYNDGDLLLLSRLENQLIKECLGYYVEEESPKGLVKKYMRPNATLLLKVLKTINPEKWEDKVHEREVLEVKIAKELIDYSE